MAFDPRDAEAGGKKVRQFTLRQTGFGPHAVDVYCTLWPEFSSIGVGQGDVVTVEGKYTSRDSGDRTFHNLSVSRIKNHGRAFDGAKPGVENAVADDEVPF